MFEFTNTKPDANIVWKELLKQQMPSGLSEDLLRTMLWILLCAGKDFVKTKAMANSVITGEASLDMFRKSFRTAMSRVEVPGKALEVNPVNLTMPDLTDYSTLFCTDDVPILPLMIFKSIFKDSDPESVVTLARKIFPVSDKMADNLTWDINAWGGNLTNLTRYSIYTLDNAIFFGPDNFRHYFVATPEISLEVSSYTILQGILLANLADAIEAGSTSTTIPHITVIDEKESE